LQADDLKRAQDGAISRAYQGLLILDEAGLRIEKLPQAPRIAFDGAINAVR